jgi:hypothetical protein
MNTAVPRYKPGFSYSIFGIILRGWPPLLLGGWREMGGGAWPFRVSKQPYTVGDPQNSESNRYWSRQPLISVTCEIPR